MAFVVWMAIFDKHNMFSQVQLIRYKQKLKAEKEYYITEKEKAEKAYQELFSNEASLEKFAREQYLMKRDNEDIYVINEREE